MAHSAPVPSKGTSLTIVNSIGFATAIASIQLLNGLAFRMGSAYLYLVLAPGFGPTLSNQRHLYLPRMAKKTHLGLSDADVVDRYLELLDHPLKTELYLLREQIKSAHPGLKERIKWNAPSYFFIEDIVTFGPPARSNDRLLLVFHHPDVVNIPSPLLEGEYKDRRLAYFSDEADIRDNSSELVRIIRLLIEGIHEKYPTS